MQRSAIMTLPLLSGVVALAISLSACATSRQLMEIEARVQSDEKVFIGVTSGGKIDVVHPPVKEACRPARADCGEQIRWLLVGPIGDGKIHVSEKAGGSLGCFRPFDLHKNHREEVQKPSQQCQQSPSAWYYDVVLTNAGGAQLDKIDPLVLVSFTPGP